MKAGSFRPSNRASADEVSTRRLKADLDWILTCPPLCLGKEAVDLSELTGPVQGADLSPVKAFLDSNAWHRVGYYFESFIESFLRESELIHNLRHSIQVFEGKQTLGELDFLFERDEVTTHLEVALKYYLHHAPEHTSGSHFMGPNARDNFEKKWDKLANHQLPFGGSHFPEIEQSLALVKGQIFYHPDEDAPAELPDAMNPNHRRGVWIRESELEWFAGLDDANVRAAILQKPFWFGPALEDEGLEISELVNELETHFEERKHPLLVSVIRGNGDSAEEVERVFVVSDTWPNDGG